MKNSKKLWIVIGIVVLILSNIFIVPKLYYYLNIHDGVEINTRLGIAMLLIKDILGVIAVVVDFILGIFLIIDVISRFNKCVDNLKFEKKPKPVKIEFKDINEFDK